MSAKKGFTRLDCIVLCIILVIAGGLRVYKINNPIADWHSWRQADTAAVGRNFVEGSFDLLRPRYDDFSNVQTGQYNPEGYRMVEFPLYNATFAALYKAFPAMSLEVYGRLVSVIFSLIIISVIYILLLYETSRTAALYGAMTYAILPFYIYFSRVVLPETTAIGFIFLAIATLYFWSRSLKRITQSLLYVMAVLFAALALLVKPTTGFYLLVLGIIFLKKYRTRIFVKPWGYILLALAIIPFFAWRLWIQEFPAGVPSYEWLITSVNTASGPQNIFMKPAFFRWIFYERILILISGGWAGLFLLLGVIRNTKKSGLILTSFGISALLYLFTFQGGNVQHDYYQTIILPALAIFTGLGIHSLYEAKAVFLHHIPLTVMIAVIFGFSWIISYSTVKGYYGYSEQLINTARVIDTITPKDALIVTDSTGDTTLLYNAHRRGMPAVSESLPNLKQRGIDYFVTGNGVIGEKVQEEYKGLFKLIFKNNDVYIFKL